MKAKRIFDIGIIILFSPLILILFAIVFILVMWLIGRPVYFRQLRPGLKCRPFSIIKFRTMNNATDALGTLLPDEKRLTKFGNFLRSTSLDELPEIWNVLRGEMSLVGPRPLLIEYVGRYNSEQIKRHDVLPGITGLAQVKGRNAISWEEKFAFDIEYINHHNIWLDLKILILTGISIIRQEGIAADGHVTMPPFLGAELSERQDESTRS